MTLSHLCEDFCNGFGNQFRFSQQGEFERVRTPFLYPDGDYIDLFCKDEGDSIYISDLAETTGWLNTQAASLHRSSRQLSLIEDACVTHGVDFHRGMIQARCLPNDDFVSTVTRVSQAALRVSDLWFTFRTQVVQTTTDSIAEFLEDHRLRFNRNEKLTGQSGRSWSIDFRVQTASRCSLVQVLTASSPSATNRICDHVLAGWFDIQGLGDGLQKLHRISLFDDEENIWAEQHFKQVEPLSEVRRWSQPDEVAAALRQAT